MSKFKCCDYRIVTQDDDGNLSMGYFVIKDIDALNEICTIMVKDKMNDTNNPDDYIKKEDEDNFNITVKRAKIPNGQSISKIEVDGNKLIRRTNFREEYLQTFFDEYTYEFAYLNSFLIFSSLMENFDKSNYGSIAKNFAKYGIIVDSSFSDIWLKCSKNLVKNKESLDYELFKDVFEHGIIEYVQVDKIIFDNFMNRNILKDLDITLSEIAYNSELLGTFSRGRHSAR